MGGKAKRPLPCTVQKGIVRYVTELFSVSDLYWLLQNLEACTLLSKQLWKVETFLNCKCAI